MGACPGCDHPGLVAGTSLDVDARVGRDERCDDDAIMSDPAGTSIQTQRNWLDVIPAGCNAFTRRGFDDVPHSQPLLRERARQVKGLDLRASRVAAAFDVKWCREGRVDGDVR